VLVKEFGTTASAKPSASSMERTAVRKVPLSKKNKITEEEPPKKKRVKKESVNVVFRPTSMRRGDMPESDEEEPANPPPAKSQKLMADAMKTAAPSKYKPKAPAPKRSTRNILTSEKEQGPNA
jgi:hypothetical protein